MRVLVIGGTGFTGPHVVDRLLHLGHEIALFHRGQTEANLAGRAGHILGDRERLEDFEGPFRRFAPQVVLDMIPSTEGDARKVMGLFTGLAQRVVAISSQDVYRAYGRVIGVESGPVDPLPLTERSALRGKLYPYRERVDPGHRLYDYDKILVEKVYLGSPELPGTILRYPMVYGPGDPQHRFFPYIKRMEDGRPAILLDIGLAGWRWTRGYAANVAAAVALAVTDERAAGRIYNVGQERALTEAAWVKAIGAATGWQGKVVAVTRERLPPYLVPDVNTTQDLVVDTSRIREELGFREEVSFEEGLSRTVAWERAHPPDDVDPESFDYLAEDRVLADGEGDER